MKADIHTLLELQHVAMERRRLRERAFACSRRMQEITALATQVQENLHKLEEKVAAIKKNIREGELALSSLEEKLQRAKTRLNAARSQKECEAAEHEIQTLQEKREKLDEQLLRLMEEQEQLDQELDKKREQWAVSATDWEQEHKRLEYARDEAQQLEQALRTDEQRLAAQLPEEIRDIFRRLLEKQQLPVVVPVKDGACGGCGTLLPLHFVQELKQENETELCPHCRRLVFFEKVMRNSGS